MSKQNWVNTEEDAISISEKAISTISGESATHTFGVIGMSSRKRLKDGAMEVLRKENVHKGVDVLINDDNSITINLFIVVKYGVNIPQVSRNIQSSVYHTISTMTGIKNMDINVIVEDVKP